jgi:hypothetical protein
MPKPHLREPYATLASDLMETMIAGLHEWRSDLSYPESHSDLRGCIDAVLRKFDVKLRPVPLDRSEIWEKPETCPVCKLPLDQGPSASHVTQIQRFDETRSTYAHMGCIKRPPSAP